MQKKYNYLGKINWLPQRLKWMEWMIWNFFISVCCPCKVLKIEKLQKCRLILAFEIYYLVVQPHTLCIFLIVLFFSFWSTVCPTWLTKQFVWASGVAKDLDSSDCYWRKKTRHEIWRYARKNWYISQSLIRKKLESYFFQIRYIRIRYDSR